MIVSPHTTNANQPNQTAGTKQYFGNKLIQSDGSMLGTDRLGTVRFTQASGAMNYYPYGEERTSTAQGQEKFGTYFRDSSGDDYAMARYYQSFGGRFETADPDGMKAAISGNPMSWNRMMYVGGDPVNFADPRGEGGDDCEYDTCVVVDGGGDPDYCERFPSDPICYAGIGGVEGSTSGTNAPTRITNFRSNSVVNATWAAIRTAFSTDTSGCSKWFSAGFATAPGDNIGTFGSLDNFLATVEPGLSGAGTFVGGSANAIEGGAAIPAGFNIAVNSSGAFFTSGVGVVNALDYSAQVDAINGGSAEAQVFILLHELAHVLDMIRSSDSGTDKTSVANQQFNNDSIWRNCGDLIGTFSNTRSN